MGLSVLLALFVCITYYYVQAAQWDTEDLRTRCSESRPTWENYHEDIKAQIGSAQVAAWKGKVTGISLHSDEDRSSVEVLVSVAVDGKWHSLEAAMPILLRESSGHTLLSHTISRDHDSNVYHYRLSDSSAIGIPTWVELYTPAGKRRYSLSPEGKWTP